MWIPVVGYWVAYFTMIFTFLATYSLPAFVGQAFSGGGSQLSGPIAVSHIVRVGGPASTGWESLWWRFGWTGVVWLTAVAVLCAWIAIKMRAGHSARGVTNLLILVVGWPICFWLAMHVLSTTASS
jgi:hypothetical protein